MKKVILILICILSLINIGCSKDGESTKTEENKDEISKENNNSKENESKSTFISPLSGVEVKEDLSDKRPVAIMFDNQKDARWQAGLGEAEIAYEFLVEGNITRYMAIYLKNSPDVIGPIRSARPYYLTALLEYDSIYVHCGGSPQAKEEIVSLGIDEVDCMSARGYVFYRNNKVGKKAPHNLYTNMNDIRKYEKEKGFDTKANYEKIPFNDKNEELDGEIANEIQINYAKYNQTSYKYDEELEAYIRYKDGEAHIDESNNKNLTATNIIVQEAETSVLDDQGRLEISTIGQGSGKYFTRGKYININWEKEDKYSKTKYFDEDQNEIKLNPGNTWIQVTPIDPSIKIF